MADFYSNHTEESLIYRIITDGLGFGKDEIPKYVILRIALALALRLKAEPLNSSLWESKRLEGTRDKEYHLGQITGKGKGSDDCDMLYKTMLYWKFKDVLKDDIFNDEKAYIELLGKNIRRGLYEIAHSWKSKDCFYRWLRDHLELEWQDIKTSNVADNNSSNKNDIFGRIEKYYKDFAINLSHISTFESYRHRICKVEVRDSDKLQAFEQKTRGGDMLEVALGYPSVRVSQCKGLARSYNIEIAKDKSEWIAPSSEECSKALAGVSGELGILAGFDIDKKPFYFDLKDAPHLIVAGTTGSGKTILLNNFISCLLRRDNVDIVVIDPKGGIDYPKEGITLIRDSEEAIEFLESLMREMNERYESLQQGGAITRYRVIIVDELNFLIAENKHMGDELGKFALIARQAGIHFVLATQNPDAQNLSRNLRTNMPGRIALRVAKARDSKVIFDEHGAEKLTGKGDMLIKLDSMNEIKRVIGLGVVGR